MSEENVTIRKESLWKYSTFILAILLMVGVFVFFLRDEDAPTGNVVIDPSAGAPTPPARAEVSVDDDAVLGDKKAPVTIIEFSDYQCPFCRKFWTETFQQLKKEYIDTGKVKFIYRDFPLSFHPMAQPSAEAAECVREKNGDLAYFKMHDKIFQEQNKLDGGDPNKGPVKSTVFEGWDKETLKKWASDIGYDIGGCLDAGKYASEVQKDFTDGGTNGVTGTPSFYIGNEKEGYIQLGGAQPFSVFRQAIEAELQ